MLIVALDLATTVGVAVGDTDANPRAHTVSVGAGGSQASKFVQMRQITTRLIRDHSPDVIALEEAIITGPAGYRTRLETALGLRTAVLIAAYATNTRVVEYSVTSIRAHFAGKGAAKKGQGKILTMDRCKRLGWPFENEDEADAYAVWAYARLKLTGFSTPSPFGLFDHADHAEPASGRQPVRPAFYRGRAATARRHPK